MTVIRVHLVERVPIASLRQPIGVSQQTACVIFRRQLRPRGRFSGRFTECFMESGIGMLRISHGMFHGITHGRFTDRFTDRFAGSEESVGNGADSPRGGPDGPESQCIVGGKKEELAQRRVGGGRRDVRNRGRGMRNRLSLRASREFHSQGGGKCQWDE